MRVASSLEAATAAAPAASGGPGVTGVHSPWHSPVPYLFGGLASMLGLIALALLILACSYWKLSGYLESGGGREEDEETVAAGAGAAGGVELYLKPMAAAPCRYEERIVVIMAGDEKPTFLATPMSSRASSFGPDRGGRDGDEGKGKVEESREMGNETQGKNQSHENRGNLQV